jgi:hypothetical protein
MKHMEEKENVYNSLVEKPERKKPFGRLVCERILLKFMLY